MAAGGRNGFHSELARGVGHQRVRETAGAQGRHRIFALSRRFENISRLVDLALKISGFARNADLVFDQVVPGFEIVISDRPIFKCGVLRQRAHAIAADHFAACLEIPRLEAPALCPIMNRRAADRVHHGMNVSTRRAGWPGALRLVGTSRFALGTDVSKPRTLL